MLGWQRVPRPAPGCPLWRACARTPGVPADGGRKVGAHFVRVDEKAGNSRRHCATCCAKWARTWGWWLANSGRGCAASGGHGREHRPTGWAAIALNCWVVSAPGGRTAGARKAVQGAARVQTPARSFTEGPRPPGWGFGGAGGLYALQAERVGRCGKGARQVLPSGCAARHVLPSGYAARQIRCPADTLPGRSTATPRVERKKPQGHGHRHAPGVVGFCLIRPACASGAGPAGP